MFKMLKNLIIGLLLVVSSMRSYAQYSLADIDIIKNDKEVSISVLSKKERKQTEENFKDPQTNLKLKNLFYTSIQTLLNNDKKICELGFIANFKNDLRQKGLDNSDNTVKAILKMLRVTNAIDDILYKVLTDAQIDAFELNRLNLNKKSTKSKASKELVEANDLAQLFSPFENYPDEKSACSYQAYWYLRSNIIGADGKKLASDKNKKTVKSLINEAHAQGLITLSTYNKLRYLHESDLDKRDLWLEDYLKITFHAKNKLITNKQAYVIKNIEDENDFSSERIKRFSKITRRRQLYRKYDETQIILLAQVLQKASRRMGVDPDTKTKAPVLSQEFEFLGAEGPKTYVEIIEFDVQSQYNLARRRMRKDMNDLQIMDIFVKQTITYEDIVMAAFETGYISLDDLEYVVRYDDLWNPHISKFEKIRGFVFNVLGYSTFFLPPPWNITASIALGLVDSIIENKNTKGADNDNASTFIE